MRHSHRSDVLRRSTAPVLEALEERRLMALSFVVTADPDGNSKLVITSNNASSTRNETINITENPNTGTTTISGSSIPLTVLPDPNPLDGNSGFEIFEISMRDGNDTVNINVTQDYFSDTRSYIVDLGEGDDDAFYTAQDLFDGTSVDMEFDCDGGNDDVTVTVQNLASSSLVIEGDGEGNSDDFIFNVGNVGIGVLLAQANLTLPAGASAAALCNTSIDASVVDIEVNLGSGSIDTIGSILGFVAPGAQVTHDFKGDTGNDRMGLVYNGEILGSLITTVALDAGNDVLDVKLNEQFAVGLGVRNGTETAEVAVPVAPFESEARFLLNGNDGNDRMNVEAGPRRDLVRAGALSLVNGDEGLSVGSNGTLEVRLIGGRGDDWLENDFASDAGLDLQGTFLLRMDGSHGRDTLLVRIDVSDCSTGNLDGDMRGGNDNDKLYLFLDAPVSAPVPMSLTNGNGLHYGPSGFFLQDGGSQTDTGYTEFNGSALGPGATLGTPIHRRNIESILLADPT